MFRRVISLVFITLAPVILLACTDREGPAERLGEQVDDAVSEAQDRLENVGDEIEEAADEIRDAANDD